jgi:hypothetical protein
LPKTRLRKEKARLSCFSIDACPQAGLTDCGLSLRKNDAGPKGTTDRG